MYRVIPDDAVTAQVDALPAAALVACLEAFAVLELVPSSAGRPYNEGNPEAPMRELVFGAAGQGAITYLLMEREREVHVLVVHWV